MGICFQQAPLGSGSQRMDCCSLLPIWYAFWWPVEVVIADFVEFFLATFILSLLVSFMAAFPLYIVGFDEAIPSIAIGVALLTVSALSPPMVRGWSDVAWLPWVDMFCFGLAGIFVGMMANLVSIIRQTRQFSRSSILLLDAAVALGVAVVIGLVSGFPRIVPELESNWLPFFLSMGVAAIACHVATLRPLDWMVGHLRTERQYEGGVWHVPCVTPLPVDAVERELTLWLDQNFEQGMAVAERLWLRTFQHQSVVQVVRTALGSQSTESCMRNVVAAFQNNSALVSNSDLNELLKRDKTTIGWPRLGAGKSDGASSAAEERRKRREKRRKLEHVPRNLTFNASYERMIAGCWYLEKKYPNLAVDALRPIGGSGLAQEMLAISQALDFFWNNEELTSNERQPLPSRPAKATRKASWEAIESLGVSLNYLWVARHSENKNGRRMAIRSARKRLSKIMNDNSLPGPEGPLIIEVAKEWNDQVEETIGRASAKKAKDVSTPPFVYSAPISDRSRYIGRNTQLDEFVQTVTAPNFQHVVLTGPKFIGKSSMLQIAQGAISGNAEMIIVDLRRLPRTASAIGQFAQELCKQVSIGQNSVPEPITSAMVTPFRALRGLH